MGSALLTELGTALAAADAEKAGQIRAQIEIVGQAMSDAMAVWQAFLDSGRTSEDRFSVVMWLGAEASKALFECHLSARAAATTLTELSTLPFSDLMGIADEVDVIMAYDALDEGESVPDRARSAIETMSVRRQALQDAVAA